jgi:hypothetical protein
MINKYLHSYQFSEYHEVAIEKKANVVFPIIKSVDFKKSKILKFLFTFRGLPKSMESINGFIDNGFILLDERENEEIVLGFLFGITVKEIKSVHPTSFFEFKDRNYIKGVWNFRINTAGNNTILSTETRVFCPTKISKIFFAIYWFLISYFSGVTRMAILKLIKQEAELQKTGSSHEYLG